MGTEVAKVAQLLPDTPFAPLTTVPGSPPSGMPHVIGCGGHLRLAWLWV